MKGGKIFGLIGIFTVTLILASASAYAQMGNYYYYGEFKIVGTNWNVTVVYEFNDPLLANLTQIFIGNSSGSYYIRIRCYTAGVCVTWSSPIWTIIGGYLEVWYDNTTYSYPTANWQTLDPNFTFLNGGYAQAANLSEGYIIYSGDVDPIVINGYKTLVNPGKHSEEETLGGIAVKGSGMLGLLIWLPVLVPIPIYYIRKRKKGMSLRKG